jgi:hypothetical protein
MLTVFVTVWFDACSRKDKKSQDLQGGPVYRVKLSLEGASLNLVDSAIVTQTSAQMVCADAVSPLSGDQQFVIYGANRSCKLKLKSFTLASGVTYQAATDLAQLPFNANDIIVYKDQKGQKEDLKLLVVTQIPENLTSDYTVNFRFHQLLSSNITFKINDFRMNGGAIVEGEGSAPALTLDRVMITLTPAPTQVTALKFYFQCAVPIAGTEMMNAVCGSDGLADLRSVVMRYNESMVDLNALKNAYQLKQGGVATSQLPGAELIPTGPLLPRGGFATVIPLSALNLANLDELRTTTLLVAHKRVNTDRYAYTTVTRLFMPAAGDLNPQLATGMETLGLVKVLATPKFEIYGYNLTSASRVIVMENGDGTGRKLSFGLRDVKPFTADVRRGNSFGYILLDDELLNSRARDSRGAWFQLVSGGLYSNLLRVASAEDSEGPDLTPAAIGYVEVESVTHQIMVRGNGLEAGVKMVIMDQADGGGTNETVTLQNIESSGGPISQGGSQTSISVENTVLRSRMSGEEGVWVQIVVAGVVSNTVFVKGGGSAVGADLTPPDSTAPVVTLIDPPSSLFSLTYNLSGTVTDPETGVERVELINQNSPDTIFAATLGAGGAFSGEVPLLLGNNTIIVRAYNRVGLKSEKQVIIRRDSEPKLTILTPASGSVVQTDHITITGTVETTLPATALLVKVGTIQQQPVPGETPSLYNFSLENVPLNGGVNQLEVSVETNSTTVHATLFVTYQVPVNYDPPEIVVTSPTAGTVLDQSSFLLAGTVRSYTGVPPTLTINGQPATLSGSDPELQTFSEVINVPVGQSTMTVELVAQDSQPKVSRVTLTFNIDATPPLLTLEGGWKEAPEINIINSDSITLTGTVQDANFGGLLINGQNIATTPVGNLTFRFSKELSFTAGQDQEVTIDAWDIGSRHVVKTLKFRVILPLELTIRAPFSGSVYRSQGENIEIPIEATVQNPPEGGHVNAALLDTNGATKIGPIRMLLTGSNINGLMITPPLEGSYQLALMVNDKNGVIKLQKSVAVSFEKVAPQLELTRITPEDGAKGINPDHFVTLQFNKGVAAEEVSVKAFETVHGKTYLMQDPPGTNYLQAIGYRLTEVNRDHEEIPGSISTLPGESLYGFYFSRMPAYGAEIFIEVKVAGQVMREISYQVRSLPTLAEGYLLDQLNEPIEGLTLQLEDSERVTASGTGGKFGFGHGDSYLSQLKPGRYKLLINPDRKNPNYASLWRWVVVEQGVINYWGNIYVPKLDPQEPMSIVGSNSVTPVTLDQGHLTLDLKNAKLQFPDLSEEGVLQAQFTPFPNFGYPVNIMAKPMWLYNLLPSEVAVTGEVGISIKMPPYKGSYDYVPPNGSLVPILAFDKERGKITVAGVGEIQNAQVTSKGALKINSLNYFGYTLPLPENVPYLKDYADKKISLLELEGRLSGP